MKLTKITVQLAAMSFFIMPILAVAQQEKPRPSQPGTPQQQRTEAVSGANPSEDPMSGKNTSGKSNTSSGNNTFMTKAAEGGLAEVALGQMALTKASSADVKQFAQRMIDDHSKADQELMDIASSMGVTLPSQPSATHKKLMSRLDKLSGADFDREYMKEMVDDHEKDVKMFERASREAGDNARLKTWVDKTLPTLHEHLQVAQETATKVGAPMGQGMATTQ